MTFTRKSLLLACFVAKPPTEANASVISPADSNSITSITTAAEYKGIAETRLPNQD
jgi:hypothetical protein